MSSRPILSQRMINDASRASFSNIDTSSFLVESLNTLRRQEDQKIYQCSDYLSASPYTAAEAASTDIVDEDARRKMCMWCYQVIDHCNLSRNTVAIAMSYLDRYASCTKESQKSILNNRLSYQLSIITTLYMAIKLHEPVALGLSALIQVSRGLFTEDDITKKECEILNALQWRISEPTPLDFVRYFMALLPPNSLDRSATNFIEDYARYQTELAVVEYKFVTVRSSYIAYASILNAIDTLSRTSPLPPYTKGLFIRSVEQCCIGMIRTNAKQVQSSLSLLLLGNVTNNNKTTGADNTTTTKRTHHHQQNQQQLDNTNSNKRIMKQPQQKNQSRRKLRACCLQRETSVIHLLEPSYARRLSASAA